MPHTPRNNEELTWPHHHRATVGVGSADAQLATKNKKHLVHLRMVVPGKLSLDLRHFDELIVDLPDDPRRPELDHLRARKLERNRLLSRP